MTTLTAGSSTVLTASVKGALFVVAVNGGGIVTVSGAANESLGPLAVRRTFGPFEIGQTITVVVQSGEAQVDYGDADPGNTGGVQGGQSPVSGGAFTPGGRLTTESGVSVSTSDRTAQSTLYYTPHTHDGIMLWDGAKWAATTFAETSLALSGLTSGKPYDVFGYLSGGGSLALELLAWTDNTTRANAVTVQSGRFCKSGDQTRLLLGTIYTTGATTTEDSAAKRFVCNVFNSVQRKLAMPLTGVTWAYLVAAWRSANADNANRVQVVSSLPGRTKLFIQLFAGVNSGASGNFAYVGIGKNTTTARTDDGNSRSGANGSNVSTVLSAVLSDCPAAGLNYYQAVEFSEIVSGAITFFGNFGDGRLSTGLVGEVTA